MSNEVTMQEASAASRGRTWFDGLTEQAPKRPGVADSVLVADAMLGGQKARFIAVVPDPRNRFPRARHGEVGLEQGWALARQVRETIDEAPGAGSGKRLPIIAIVDVIGQAYGRREELMGIHIACAAAANAYADARMAGHPVIALIVGHAMSGAFLAHGYQANRIIALDAPDVLVHAMGQAAAARITRRSVEELVKLGERIPPMSYDIRNYHKLGLLDRLIGNVDADAPDAVALDTVRRVLTETLESVRADNTYDLSARYRSKEAQTARAASIEVRKRLAEQW
ncbi:biotin-independent malonate decarboxylase subunit gamma [Caballeronia sp. LjRoot34]|uniref:biotin-independent malonate decarboxylase subunit gamma n=1 Tax=Caballeronia sp. LjRoot34 TaxID=3342325 RepID=UPI003ECCE09B